MDFRGLIPTSIRSKFFDLSKAKSFFERKSVLVEDSHIVEPLFEFSNLLENTCNDLFLKKDVHNLPIDLQNFLIEYIAFADDNLKTEGEECYIPKPSYPIEHKNWADKSKNYERDSAQLEWNKSNEDYELDKLCYDFDVFLSTFGITGDETTKWFKEDNNG